MLDKPVIQALIEQAHKRSYPPRHTIIHAGGEPQSLYLIIEGSVSIFLEDDTGREMVLAYLNPGEFFGEMCLFPEQRLRTAVVRTREPTLVAETGYQMFRQFYLKHPEIMFEIAGQLASHLRDTSRRLGDLAFLDVSGRVAHVLLEMANKPGAIPNPRGTVVRISRQELASNVGCSREMAGRVLKKLSEDGVVITQGRNILILHRQRRSGNS
ncbi:MAG: cyclic nucleotide-binding domain-containing protein [Stenotrophobium sp.]